MTTNPASALVIRPIADDEYDAVGDLVVRAYSDAGHLDQDHGYDVVLRDVRARAACGPVLVATPAADPSTILGSVTICPPGTLYAEIARPDETEFRFLAVDPAASRRGVATALVDACIDHARSLGHRALVLSVIDWNEPGHRLYRNMGFLRAPERDWVPIPEIRLLVSELKLRMRT